MTDTLDETVDLLVEGIGHLVTVDGGRRIIQDAAVAVAGNRIVAVGTRDEVAAQVAGMRVIRRLDARGGVMIPGMIDCHLHSSFQLARGLADEANAREFLVQRMYPYEAALTPLDVELSAQLAAREMVLNGTTCFVDPGNVYPAATLKGVGPVGIRTVLARSAFDLVGSDFGSVPENLVSTPETAANEAEDLIEEHRGSNGGLVDVSVSFRGLNNSSDDLIERLVDVAERHDTMLQMHACFSYSTHDASIAKFGETEIARLARLGALGRRTLVAHAGWLEPDEMGLIRDSKTNVTVNPTSSMHNGYGVIKMGLIPEMLADGVNIALGSDHASSGSIDLVREMFLISCGFKEVRLMPRVMPPETALEMVTINAATAIGRAADLGSIEVGKLADLVLFDADSPAWMPLYNPVSNLVYAASGATVSTVVVNGAVVVDDSRLTGIDEEDLVSRVRGNQHDLTRRLTLRPLTTARWPLVGQPRRKAH